MHQPRGSRVNREVWSPSTEADVPALLNVRPKVVRHEEITTTAGGENDQVISGIPPGQRVNRLVKKVSTIFRRRRSVDDIKMADSRQIFDTSAPLLPSSSVAITHKTKAEFTLSPQPTRPRFPRTWRTDSGKEQRTQGSLNRSLIEDPSSPPNLYHEEENKKSPSKTSSKNVYGPASISPECQSSRDPTQLTSASIVVGGNTSPKARRKPLSERLRVLKNSSRNWIRRKSNAPTSHVLRNPLENPNTKEQNASASPSSLNALSISGSSNIESKSSVSIMEPSTFGTTPGSKVPTLSHPRTQDISDPGVATSRVYKREQTEEIPSRSIRHVERQRPTYHQRIGQSYIEELSNQSQNIARATAGQNKISMTKSSVEQSGRDGRSLSKPSLPKIHLSPPSPAPQGIAPSPPMPPPQMLRRRMSPPPGHSKPPSPAPEGVAPSPPIPPPQMLRQWMTPPPHSPIPGFKSMQAVQSPPTPTRQRRASPYPGSYTFGSDGVGAAKPAPTPTRQRRASPYPGSYMSGFDGVEVAQPLSLPTRRQPLIPSSATHFSGFDSVKSAKLTPTPTRQQRVTPHAGSCLIGFDGANDLWMVDNYNKNKHVSTYQSIGCKASQDKSKRVPITPVSLTGMACKDDKLLKRVEQHGVYTITYGSEEEDVSEKSDAEAEPESDASTLALVDDAGDGELEPRDGQSDDRYSIKLESHGVYQFRYFDEPEQDGRAIDVEPTYDSKYGVLMNRFVDTTALDGACGPKMFVERKNTFINTHYRGIELKSPSLGNTFHRMTPLPNIQLDGPSDAPSVLSHTRSRLASSDFEPSFSTRQSFKEITQRLLSTSSTQFLPLLERSDNILEPRKYNPDSSSTESLSASAMNPVRRRAMTAGSRSHEDQVSPSPRRVRFEDISYIENTSPSRAPRSQVQTDHSTLRDASLSSQASNQLSASSQVVPFALDERVTGSRSYGSRRLPFYGMSTTPDLPSGNQNAYGDSLNTSSRYEQQHPFNRTPEMPPQSPMYASSMEHSSAKDMSSSDDIFRGPPRARARRGLPPQSLSTTQGLNILYDDPIRNRVAQFLQPDNFDRPHSNELASQRFHTRRLRRFEGSEASGNKTATSEAGDDDRQTLYGQLTARHHITGELRSPPTVAHRSDRTSGFNYQPSTSGYERQNRPSVKAPAFRAEQATGTDRQHTVHGYSGNDSLSQYSSPLQSGRMPSLAHQQSVRVHESDDWSFDKPTAFQIEHAYASGGQPKSWYDDNEYSTRYVAPVPPSQTANLKYQYAAPGHDLQGFPSEDPTKSHAGQAYGLDHHLRTYDSISSDSPSHYSSILRANQTNQLAYTAGMPDYLTREEFLATSVHSRRNSTSSMFRRPRLHGQHLHGTVDRHIADFQAHESTLSSTPFGTRGRTALNPSSEVSYILPMAGISRSTSASPNRAHAALSAGPPQLNKAVPPLPSLRRSNTIGSSASTTHGRTAAPPQLTRDVSALGRSNTTGGSVSPVRREVELPEDLEDYDDGIYGVEYIDRPTGHRAPTKILFGEKGILGGPTPTWEPSQEQKKGKTALRRLKEKVKTMTSDVRRVMTSNTNIPPFPQPPASTPSRHPPVSLSPTIQARLFGELELILTTTINTYLNNEKDEGRMSLESVEKIVKRWKASHQSMPTDFMFDLGTQLRLVQANCDTFRFYGEHQGSNVRLDGMFRTWEGLARRLNRRTLATPDAEIRKYLADISNIFNLVGASTEAWATFEFWRSATVVAIEAVGAEEKARAAIPWGVTRQVYTGTE